jgi:capsular polysaccharide biosynthesis protein
MLLGGVSAFAGSKLIRSTYRATTLLVVGQTTPGSDPYTGLLASEQLVTTYLRLISQPVVLQRAAAQVGGITAQQLASRVSVKDQAGTQVIELDVDDTSAVRAAQLANAVAAAFIGMQQENSSAALAQAQQLVNQQLAQVSAQITTLTAQSGALSATTPNSPRLQVLQQQLAAAVTRRDALQTASTQLTTQAFTATTSGSVFQPATPPAAPDHPRPLLNAVIGATLGLIIAAALIWLLAFFDDRIRTPEQAEDLLGLSLLATVGAHRGRALLLGRSPRRKLAMNIRELVAKLDLAHLGDPPRTIAVARASSGEGRTTIATNLAVMLARNGKRVLLVDDDLRKPRQADLRSGTSGAACYGGCTT